MVPDIWFWQGMVTPHMMGLAVALSNLRVNVTYVAAEVMSADRVQQGWLEPYAADVIVHIAQSQHAVHQLVNGAPKDSIHICGGVRVNGLVGVAQKRLANLGFTQWLAMETVMDVGWIGILKRLEYRRLFRGYRRAIRGVLAIGHKTPQWVIRRGVTEEKVFPFAYFLEEIEQQAAILKQTGPFKFIFVGQFIPRKRLNRLITALGLLTDQNFELVVIGSGPLEDVLRVQAQSVLGDRVNWIGKLPSSQVSAYMAAADCLILPSSHDGWGAVISEALMCGTPVICSDTCGAAGVVHNSGVGSVFKANDTGELQASLETALRAGTVSTEQRAATAVWGKTLGAKSGAQYLLDILTGELKVNKKPMPPWVNDHRTIGAVS